MKSYQCLNCGKDCAVSHQKFNKYCSVKCQKEFEYKQFITEWKAGKQVTGSKRIRRYVLEKYNNTCCECGIDSWRGKLLTLEVEHIDGDSLNNNEENLILLCPNCHSQTPTYKSKNRGKGRHARRQRYIQGKSY